MAQLDQNLRIDGFDEIIEAFKKFEDDVKRKELLKIMKREAKPLETAIRDNTPIGETGNLMESVATVAQSKRRSGGEPVIFVGPQGRLKKIAKKEFVGVGKRYLGFHKHLVIRGHVTPNGGRTTPQPFVDEAARGVMPAIKGGLSESTKKFLKRKLKRRGFEVK